MTPAGARRDDELRVCRDADERAATEGHERQKRRERTEVALGFRSLHSATRETVDNVRDAPTFTLEDFTMTIKGAIRMASDLGITIKRVDGEFIVKPRGERDANDAVTYYTDDIDDALATARMMAARIAHVDAICDLCPGDAR
jgi:hypothetical protein